MGIPLGSSFDRTSGVALDSSFIVANSTARDAIGAGIRYDGMLCYVVADQAMYQLKGGILNANWAAAGGGGGSVPIVDLFTGNGFLVAFTPTQDPVTKENVAVYIDGVRQSTSEYNIVGGDVEFNIAPYIGAAIMLVTGGTTAVNVPAVGSVKTASIDAGAVTKDKLAPLGQVVSSSSGLFTTTSGLPTDVTNLSANFTTTGRLIELCLISDGIFAGGFSASVGVAGIATDKYVGGTILFLNTTSGTVIDRQDIIVRDNATPSGASTQYFSVPSSSYRCFVQLAAGTYNFKVQAQLIWSTGATMGVTNTKLLIKEL